MSNNTDTTQKNSSKTTRRGARRGFTLIEILIVVVILGVLAALVIPGVTSALGDANNNAAVARASQITTMVTRWNQFNTPVINLPTTGASMLDVETPLQALTQSTNGKPAYCSADDLKNQIDNSYNWYYDATTKKFSAKAPSTP